ncbi:MAG: hypothetical protein ACRDRX_07485 [Pseudonocardiaceae bacterium]
MKNRTRTMLVTLTVASLLSMGAPHASAAEGKVLVFTIELAAATVYDNPTGCIAFPPLAHIVVNQTNADIKIYAGPSCFGFPLVTAKPGYGGHISPIPATNSFSP